MSLIYSLEEVRSRKGKYFARARKTGKVSLEQIAREIAENTTANPGDVYLVLTELTDVMRNHLHDGKEVEIPGIGKFYVGIRSDMVDDPEAFSAANIRGFRLNFRPWRHRDPLTWKLSCPLLDGIKTRRM